MIVKRLASIENFGSMNVLCCDKTGTLTEGTVKMHSALDAQGKESQEVFLYAYLNSFFETGFTNPIDQAILAGDKPDLSGFKKLDEVPYDFIRKRLSILVSKDEARMISDQGRFVQHPGGLHQGPARRRHSRDLTGEGSMQQEFGELSRKGFRVLGLACRGSRATSAWPGTRRI